MGPTRSLILKILPLSAALAAAILLLIDIAAQIGGSDGCATSLDGFPAPLANATDLDAAFRELIARDWLAAGDRAICVGPDSGPAVAAMSRLGFRAAIAASASACCGLPFEEGSFDFAFSAALDRVRVPARVVLEMERVLQPGRIGAVFRLRSGPIRPGGLMKAAAPVASLLRFSDVIGARAVNGSEMVVFKKRATRRDGTSGNIKCEDAFTRIPVLFRQITKLIQASLVIQEESFGQLA